MAYDPTNKRIYVDTSTTPNVGVSINDVKTCLNESSNDLGTLCKSNQINHFSPVKPIRSDELLISDFARENYGFNVDMDVANAIIAPLEDILDEAEQNSEWANSYLKPRGMGGGDADNDEWYRLLDFNGYEHLAQSPVVSTKYNGDQPPAQSAYPFTLDVDNNQQPMFIGQMDIINEWSGTVATGQNDDLIYVLVYQMGGRAVEYQVGNPASAYNGSFNGHSTFSLTNVQPGMPVRACVAIVSLEDYTEHGRSAIGLFLPSTYCAFKRTSPSGGVTISNIVVYSHGNSVDYVESLEYSFAITNNSAWPIKLEGMLGGYGESEYDMTRRRFVMTNVVDFYEGDFNPDCTGVQIAANGGSANIYGTVDFESEVDDTGAALRAWLDVYFSSNYDSYTQKYRLEVFGDSASNWGDTQTTDAFVAHPQFMG